MWIQSVLVLAFLGFGSRPEVPEGDFFGVGLGMSREAVEAKLAPIGTRVAETEKGKVAWELRDKRYHRLILRFGADGRVRWMTAFARESSKIRYRDIGDLARAGHVGRHLYTWTVPSRPARPGYGVTARGSHAERMSSVSIFPLEMLPGATPVAALPDTMWIGGGESR